MTYPDEHRGHEAYCEQRCAWSQRCATPEGALVLAEHHTRTTRAAALAAGSTTGHSTSTRAVTR